jgi:hypothetical protein
VDAQLRQYGYDDDALNAGAFLKAAIPLEVVEKFLRSARRQLAVTIREAAAVRQEMKLRAEQLRKRILIEHQQLRAKRVAEQQVSLEQ